MTRTALFSFITLIMFLSCSRKPETPEEVMIAYLEALADCDTETLNELSVQNYDWECSPYETEVINVNCKTDGKWKTCCCEEEVEGKWELNGKIYSQYSLSEVDRQWKVAGMQKISDLGFDGVNICD